MQIPDNKTATNGILFFLSLISVFEPILDFQGQQKRNENSITRIQIRFMEDESLDHKCARKIITSTLHREIGFLTSI